jgi:transposase-like protein
LQPCLTVKDIRRRTRRRFSAEEKIRIVIEGMRGEDSVVSLCRREGISANLYCRWSKDFLEAGKMRLAGDTNREASSNEVGGLRRELAQFQEMTAELLFTAVEFEVALAETELSPREIVCQMIDREGLFLSESTVYRILKSHDLITSPAYILMEASDSFRDQTSRPNEMWQTDFTYLLVVGWGWYYLSTILDDYSRKILAWKLTTTMAASDVTETLDLARAATGGDTVRVEHRPRLLSDNGPCYVSYYNERRYHESLGNITPTDIYDGRHNEIQKRRMTIKRKTMAERRRENLKTAA